MQNVGFNGKNYDNKTALYDYGFRHYNALTGRWNRLDPIKDGYNWYVYCSNDPVNYVDPNGLWFHIALAAAAGGTVNALYTLYSNPDASLGDVGKSFLVGAAVGGAVAAVGPLAAGVVTSLTGSTVVGGAITSGVASGLQNTIGQVASGQPVDYGEVLVATGTGAVLGGVVGYISSPFGNDPITQSLVETLVGVFSGTVVNIVTDMTCNW